MKLRSSFCYICLTVFCAAARVSQTAPAPAAAPSAVDANAASLADVETQRCQDKIANVQRDTLNKYEDGLQELQNTFQKAADLEGAIAVRTERQRLAAESILTEKNFVNEPKALRALQMQTVARIKDLVTQLVQESVPRLIELKKSLTVAGKLDEAVAVRTSIEQLQNSFVPISRAEAGSVVTAETVLQAYAGDRPRADKQYKGQRLTVRGVLGGYRQDPNDSKNYFLYLTGGSLGDAWVQCSFPASDFRFREENQFSGSFLVINSKDYPSGLRVQKGQTLDIRGTCEGWDELVKLSKCDLPK